MNSVIEIGWITKEPEVRYSQGENPLAIARFDLGVRRKVAKEGEKDMDFLHIVTFGKKAEFVEKYFHKGMKVAVKGYIKTDVYKNKDNVNVYTFDIVAEEVDFAGGRETEEQQTASGSGDGFMNIPDGIDEGLPFN